MPDITKHHSGHEHAGLGLGQTALASFEATLSILLIIAYGFGTSAAGLLSHPVARAVSKAATHVMLPALMAITVGPELDVHDIHELAPLLLWTLVTILLAHAVGYAGHRLFRLPGWSIATCGLPNATALPLLLLEALNTTGLLDDLRWGGESSADALQRGRVYVLVATLIQQLIAFSLSIKCFDLDREQPSSEETERLLDGVENGSSDSKRQPSPSSRPAWQSWPIRAMRTVRAHLNPPLWGGILSLVLGLIPWTHDELLLPSGVLYPSIGASLQNLGELFPSLQAFVLGGALFHADRARVSVRTAAFVLFVRFALMPLISISAIYGIATHFTGLRQDPMMLFVLMISPAGPPALLVSSIAQLAARDEGPVSTMLVVSYIASPLLSFTCAAALAVVRTLNLR